MKSLQHLNTENCLDDDGFWVTVAAALPDERKGIWVSTRLCVFCKRSTAVLFGFKAERRGEQFSCNAQGINESRYEDRLRIAAVPVRRSM